MRGCAILQHVIAQVRLPARARPAPLENQEEDGGQGAGAITPSRKQVEQYQAPLIALDWLAQIKAHIRGQRAQIDENQSYFDGLRITRYGSHKRTLHRNRQLEQPADSYAVDGIDCNRRD